MRKVMQTADVGAGATRGRRKYKSFTECSSGCLKGAEPVGFPRSGGTYDVPSTSGLGGDAGGGGGRREGSGRRKEEGDGKKEEVGG